MVLDSVATFSVGVLCILVADDIRVEVKVELAIGEFPFILVEEVADMLEDDDELSRMEGD